MKFLFLSLILAGSAHSANRCENLVNVGELRFTAESAEASAEIYQMPKTEALRSILQAETQKTKERLKHLVDPSFRKLLIDTRAENTTPVTPSAPTESTGINESTINGVTYRWRNHDSLLPDFQILTTNSVVKRTFAINALKLSIAKGESLVPLHLSPDQKTLILGLGSEQRDQIRLFFFSLNEEEKLTHQEFLLKPAYFTFSWYGSDAGFWSKDSKHFFIAVQGDGQENGRFIRFDRGADLSLSMNTVYENLEGDLYLDLLATPNRDRIVFTTYHYGRFFASKVYDLAQGELIYDSYPITQKRSRLDMAIAHDDGFIIVKSEDYKTFEIVSKACAQSKCVDERIIANEALNPVLASVKDYTLSAKVDKGHAFFSGYQNGRPAIAGVNLKSGEVKIKSFPEGSEISLWSIGGDQQSPVIQFGRKNIFQQSASGQYNYVTGEIKEAKLLVDYDSKVDRKEIEVISSDGVKIPVTVLSSKGSELSSKSKMMVYLYGEYGTATFNNWAGIDSIMPLIKRGWVVAFPHQRGSIDYGYSWYLAGTRNNKLQGFEDAKAALKGLHKLGISDPDHTAIKGYSAGGVMISTLTAYAPELFKIGFFEWPIVDSVNSILLPQAPIDSKNRFAMGNPELPQEFDYLCPVSGMHTINQLPARNLVWITTSFGDTNVVPQTAYGFYKKLEAKYPEQVFFYGSTSGDHLTHSSDEEMADFLTMQLSWAESELK